MCKVNDWSLEVGGLEGVHEVFLSLKVWFEFCEWITGIGVASTTVVVV